MSEFFKAHRILAMIVLIAAGLWVGTGEFSAVGSQEADAAVAEGEAPAEAPPAPVARTVAAVTPVFVDHAREIRIAGATAADKQVILAARSNGIVEELGVQQGAEVSAGTLVMRLEGADVMAAVETAKASLAQAAEQLEVGESLYRRGNLPELELSGRRAAKSAAETVLSQAQSAADRLLLQAPFSGTVDSVVVELGEWVQQGTPITTILALDPIVVKAEVSERDVAYVSIGSKAQVRLVSGEEMEGTIRHVSRQASEETRTFVVEVALPNADRKIPAGMTAEISLFTAPQPAVIVPRSVITLSEDGLIGLRVVGADNKAAFAPVTVIDDGANGMVVTGVPKDVKVIVAGQDLVSDGDSVTVSELTTEQAAEALK